MKKIVDKIDMVLKHHEILSTDFLNPYDRECALTLIRKFPIGYHADGGYPDAERQLIYLYPDYFGDTAICDVVMLSYAYGDVTHRDVLGALLGLGIDRTKVGDIVVEEDRGIFIFVKKELADFLNFEFHHAGRIPLVKTDVSFTRRVDKVTERQVIISSLRVDVVLSAAFHLSRSQAASLIKNDKLTVNFKPTAKVHEILSSGDILSLRGYGRVTLYEVQKKTKKDNYVVILHYPV
ncbi:YlmH/Sll1252 family protein [Peptoniphilus equinus]|uniref:YlmH/Sll1252 family protein n=1 Tax=Peptoniphilus equinus TaxID=3016343 RepID=A0ABY7QX93_9FIRM|nr:YlmH/Sll1252 family protein [Peptoniphilus equinus]WBW50714.1 YlmH/Sll1252 family protein [Peptoniphilus equinus]